MRASCKILLFICSVTVASVQAQDIHQYYDFGQDAKLLASTPLAGGLIVGVGELIDSANTQGWVSLFTSSGEVLWTMATSDPNHQCRLQQVVAGTDSMFYIGGTIFIDSIRGYDLVVTQLTVDGQIKWSRIIHGNYQDELTGLAIYTVWNDPFFQSIIPVGSTVIDSSNVDILVANLSNEGLYPHSNILGGPGIDMPYQFINRSRYGYISGTTNQDGISNVPMSGFLIQVDLDVIHIDYERRFEGWTGNITPEALTLNYVNEPLIALNEDTAPSEHYLISFLTPANIKWASSYNSNQIKALHQTSTGMTHAITDNEIFNLDSDGKVVDAWKYKLNPTFRCTDVSIGTKNDYLISGFTTSQGYRPTVDIIQDPAQLNCDISNTSIDRQNYGVKIKGTNMGITGKGIIDSFQMSMSNIIINRNIECQTTSNFFPSQVNESLSLYPNPTNGNVTITLPYTTKGILSWYRSDGTLVSTSDYNSSISTIHQNISAFPSGTYNLEFYEAGNQIWSSKVILVK